MIQRTICTSWPCRTLALLLLLCGLALTASAQQAFVITHKAILSGENEVPATTSKGYGIAIMKVDYATMKMEYRITITNLGEPVTGAHFHLGENDTTGPAVHTITWPSDAQTVTGSWQMTEEQITQLESAEIYLNIHTATDPAGAIRGQVEGIANGACLMFGAYEVPQVTTNGLGIAVLFINPTARTAVYSAFWQGLSGPATMAHFHRGPVGQNGPVITPMTVFEGSVAAGIWADLTDQDLNDLANGKIYMNVHTEANPDGEIRGQVQVVESYGVALSPQNESPAVTGSNAMGTGVVGVTHQVNGSYSVEGDFVVHGTTGPITMAHFHRGGEGNNGQVISPLVKNDTTPEHWEAPAGLTLEAADMERLRTGRVYANFHTEANGGGEVRGQLIAAINNFFPTAPTAAPQEISIAMGSTLAAIVDRSSNQLRFRIASGQRTDGATITLFNVLGQRVAATTVDGDVAAIPLQQLPGGAYFARLERANQVLGICNVAVAR
ncbi:MAG: CHRD domain-containing protein [Candidatus Kapabacteria bacterium]|nr:CHRD domain-containing protein [Candidatus Kapabacteria bacterium]